MSVVLRVDYKSSVTDAWATASKVLERGLGSLSSDPDFAPRELYLFGWRDDELGVWRSVAGLDFESTPGERVLLAFGGVVRVWDFDDGPCCLTLKRSGGREIKARIRLEAP